MRACSSAIVDGWTGWARSHFFIVCWKRSTFPQVCGWLGREFFWVMCRRRSSFSRPVLPPRPPANLVVNPGGEHHPVVGQRGGRDPVQGNGLAERREHDRAGDPRVGGDRERIAGMWEWSSSQLMISTSRPGVPSGLVSR